MKFPVVKALALLAVPSLTSIHALKTAVESPVEMVVTAHPLATEAGLKVLKAGGTVADAMVAIQTVLGLVEPQSSGMGGGAFVVYHDASTKQLTTFDAREKAPSGATENRFLTDGQPLFFLDAWQSALSVGVPGVPKLMETLHDRYGVLPWADLFEDAITIAEEGWEMTARSQGTIDFLMTFNPPGHSACVEGDDPWFLRDAEMFDYMMDNATCTAKPAGTMATNPEYADLMERMAAKGASAFYEGKIAQEIVTKVANDRNPTGDPTITLEDLRNYEVVERLPVCQMYGGQFQVGGMGPPSSGGLAVGQIFGILDNLNMTSGDVQDPENVHLFTQAMRLAFADRDLYVGDSDFVPVPANGMLDETYLAQRAALVDSEYDMGTATAGTPPGELDIDISPQTTDAEGGTSHISIVDQYGNALSMTSSIEGPYGAGLMVHGVLLNNQLTDFFFAPNDEDGLPIANRVQANKRPRSSMSPTIVLDTNSRPVFLSGSPGGPRIIGYTAQSLLSMLKFGLDPQEAANLPHFQNRNSDTELEPPKPNITSDYEIEALQNALVTMNHTVLETGGGTSGLGIIAVKKDGTLVGGADPRRGGTANGRASLEEDEPSQEHPDSAESTFVGVTLLIGFFGAFVLAIF